jgi:predicted site-specific integrase-resolvase
VITKEYKGTTYQVKVMEKGFEYNAKIYKTLSSIAKEITGAYWNGYLFFNLQGGLMEKAEKKKVSCAIYTRVSTSEGLEQEFTSLNNQRESVESYIQSQKSKGWMLLPERYDDGGYTGANTERPALQKLLSDIKDGNINCVIVYKVDRLSRSLLGFSQLLEFFEQNNVMFVSVTQAFNTNTSIGRLTLNILLSLPSLNVKS